MRLVVTVVLAAPMLAPADAGAGTPSLQCKTIQRHETAAAVARRVTGRAENRREPWFRIVNRTSVIPKSAYSRLLPGWQACIPTERGLPRVLLARAPSPPTLTAAPSTPVGEVPSTVLIITAGSTPPSPSGGAPVRGWPLALALMCLGPAVFGAAIGFGWQSVERIVMRRRALTRELQRFGDVFVSEFERPLRFNDAAVRPVRARLRSVPRDRRLEILLAPGPGRRYPNLDDHRCNVEYDVERIAGRLRNYSFVLRPLRVEGAWVVIPFEFNPGPDTGAAA